MNIKKRFRCAVAETRTRYKLKLSRVKAPFSTTARHGRGLCPKAHLSTWRGDQTNIRIITYINHSYIHYTEKLADH